LHKAEFKSTGLFDMVEEISWQIRVQAVAWFLLAAFCKFYSENWKHKAEQKGLKNLYFDQKASVTLG
jgi:hypothetical protein